QSLVDPAALVSLPPQRSRLLGATVLIAAVIVALWKELFIGTFDPAFAASVGARPRLVSGILIVLVALAAVTAFDAVRPIIVVAMFICPPAAARLMTDNLRVQIWWSVVFAVMSAVVGYVL